MKRKIAIGISGASGAIYAKLLLAKLNTCQDIEFSVVMSKQAMDIWEHELQDASYNIYSEKMVDEKNYYVPFASGSSSYEALVICPCSMGTIGRIASGISDNLITRAADVMLKEKRKLICVVRETPYNLIHLQNMKLITESGGIICPASPSYYSLPKSIEELASTVVERVVSLLGIDSSRYKWKED
ncbi:MAG: UbiX family flavin prenyltransferase [Chitinophagaceae bacterium]